MEDRNTPKVFISYSWTNESHQKWVIGLGEKLRANGIDVILDVWDLKQGQDKYKFMEQMVTDETITKVLIICDKKYKEKSDMSKGGVGTESQIISSEVYNKVQETKFIPIVVEYENGIACAPVFLKSRIHIDYTDDMSSEPLESLIRAIFDKPVHVKPPLGKAPFYLNETANISPTSGKYLFLKEAIEKNKISVNGALNDFIQEALELIEANVISEFSNETPHDEQILESIDKLKSLRDQIIHIISTCCSYDKEELIKTFGRFLESCVNIQEKREFGKGYRKYQTDNVKFFIKELFLYIIAILIKNGKFKIAFYFIQTRYVVKKKFEKLMNITFCELNEHIGSLDDLRKERIRSNLYSLSYDLMKDRADFKGLNFESICEADFLMWLASVMRGQYWFPGSLVYLERHSIALELFVRAESNDVFEEIKGIIGVENIEDLRLRVQKLIENNSFYLKYYNSFDYLPFDECLNLQNLATF